MKIEEILDRAKETITVKRVYAEPIERNGVTFIPAASVGGGAGGGTGHDEKGQEGEGGGFGVSARPAGAYVLKGDEVSWRPAIDPNRIITMVGLVVVAYLLTRPRMARARAKGGRGM
jgi:uncharacterized spore protein YtfJ